MIVVLRIAYKPPFVWQRFAPTAFSTNSWDRFAGPPAPRPPESRPPRDA